MKEVTLKIPDKEYNFFMKLIKSLGFVSIEKSQVSETNDNSKEDIINKIKEGFEEMKLIKEGKKQATPLKDFLNEL